MMNIRPPRATVVEKVGGHRGSEMLSPAKEPPKKVDEELSKEQVRQMMESRDF